MRQPRVKHEARRPYLVSRVVASVASLRLSRETPHAMTRWTLHERRSPMTDQAVERLQVAVKTPAGLLTTPVEVPTGFVPVTAIVPLMRRIGEQAEALEERKSIAAGEAIS